MLKLIRNSAVLLGGAILLAALAVLLGLFTLRPQAGTAQQPAGLSGGIPDTSASTQPNLATLPAASPTVPATPRPYPALDPESVALLTKDWLVFENQEFGFRIKYPPTFFTTVWEVSGDLLFDLNFTDQKWKDAFGGVQGMGLAIYANPQELPLTEWFQRHSGSFTPQDPLEGIIFVDPTQVESVTIRDQAALKFANGGVIELPSTLIAKGPYVFHIWYGPGPDNLEPIYELLLSTLELTK